MAWAQHSDEADEKMKSAMLGCTLLRLHLPTTTTNISLVSSSHLRDEDEVERRDAHS